MPDSDALSQVNGYSEEPDYILITVAVQCTPETCDRVTQYEVCILKSKYLLKDVAKLSPPGQTSHLEGFHSVICHFAPKFYHYHYNGVEAIEYWNKLLMSALHFNENGSRHNVHTKTGQEKWSVFYPKSRNWKAAAIPLKKNPTYVGPSFPCLGKKASRTVTDLQISLNILWSSNTLPMKEQLLLCLQL
ncbi:uncharacterized protein LOC124143070 [Haliotis rufescens]|uniref:uncharacterized protein LOC124143070 n=1 Tax=Haliotis rufescens TaxID=6454 RepID=UPI00201F6BD0|nr:uncharacterized protein LOC124143070 [Haliotis rufescens]